MRILAGVLSWWICAFAFASPQNGWYWNPNESGRGFFIENQSGVTFIGAYLYEADGHATWLLAGGANSDPYNFSGQLFFKSKGQTLFGNYVPPGDATNVGEVSLHFSDDTHATLTWPGGVVAIERFIFGGGQAKFQPFTGWWWNPAKDGTGYSIELQGNSLFVVGFFYDDSGRPVWYFSAGPMTSATTYSGPVLQFADGQTIGGPYHPPGTPVTVATLDVEFTATNAATIHLTRATAASASGATKAGESYDDELAPLIPKPPEYTLPDYIGGGLLEILSDMTTFGPASASGAFTVNGQEMLWQLNSVAEGPGGGQIGTYILRAGTFSVNFDGRSVVSVPGASATCTTIAKNKFILLYPFTANLSLNVSTFRHYDLDFRLGTEALSPLPGVVTCVDADGRTTSDSVQLPGPPVELRKGSGAVSNGVIEARFGPEALFIPNGSGSLTQDYSFFETEDCGAYCPPSKTGIRRTRR